MKDKILTSNCKIKQKNIKTRRHVKAKRKLVRIDTLIHAKKKSIELRM